jgi:hypothetical protein
LARLRERKSGMLYKLGRFFQLAALVILPLAIAGEVAEKIDLKESLGLSAIGILLFFLGWLLQQASRRR